MEDSYITIFGATGDLARKKIYKSLYDLYLNKELENINILGLGRNKVEDLEYRDLVKKSLTNFSSDKIDDFLDKFSFIEIDYSNKESLYNQINTKFSLEKGLEFLFYMAIPPSAFQSTIDLVYYLKNQAKDFKIKLLIEKPFGEDLESAQYLNKILKEYFEEEEIYRVDHYLGKETIQNIIALRFGNSIFEPMLNNHYVEDIHIDVFESIGVEDRAEYFDQNGIIKDMFQSHILQIMAMFMMESPVRMEAEFIRDEKYKVLRSLKPIDIDKIKIGQYLANNNQNIKSYLEEEGTPTNSKTETYFEVPIFVDNLRWEGVPIYIRTGKRMSEKKAEIRVVFKESFRYFMNYDEECNPKANELVISIQPEEEIYLSINAKMPGKGMCIQPIKLNFTYTDLLQKTIDPYTRLIKDAIEGDQKLFVRKDEIEQAWEFVMPLIKNKQKLQENLVYYKDCDPKELLKI